MINLSVSSKGYATQMYDRYIAFLEMKSLEIGIMRGLYCCYLRDFHDRKAMKRKSADCQDNIRFDRESLSLYQITILMKNKTGNMKV